MSNIEFKLISPEKLKETCQTDWRLCFICQIEIRKKFSLFIIFFLQYCITLNLQLYCGGKIIKIMTAPLKIFSAQKNEVSH